MTVYLHLFHGRRTPDEQTEDWGWDGPTFKSAYVHTTYAHDIKLNTGLSTEGFEYLAVIGDCVYYDGSFYGDWSVHDQEAEALAEACRWCSITREDDPNYPCRRPPPGISDPQHEFRVRLEPFNPIKAEVPKRFLIAIGR